MTAQEIHESIPIGAWLRYSDGMDKPRARFIQKLRAWEGRNGYGRLTEKTPHGFTLSSGDDWCANRQIFSIESRVRFDVLAMPAPAASA
jgi:hypothetical protein